MSASKALRRLLRAANVEYDSLGGYYTRVAADDLIWVARDNYDGTLALHVAGRHTPEDAIEIMRGRTTTVTTTVDDDGVGDSVCDGCGRTVGEWFQFCPWCGRRFVERRRKHV